MEGFEMKCPKCGNPSCRYTTKKKENKPRENFEAKCNKCGFKGEIK
jgi:DNA-directed RNA polymerase subunit M/transcription elongation factor TFIIS